MQTKATVIDTVKNDIGKAVAHDKLKAAIDQAKKTLEELSTFKSLQAAQKGKEAHESALTFYNEIFEMEELLESLGISGWANPNAQNKDDPITKLQAHLGKIKSIKGEYNDGYCTEYYSLDGRIIPILTKFSIAIEALENTNNDLQELKELGLNCLKDNHNDVASLLKQDIQAKMYFQPPVKEGEEFKFLTKRVMQKINHDLKGFSFTPLQYAAYMGSAPAVELICSKLSSQKDLKPETLKLTGEYGVIALSRASHCDAAVIPYLVKKFPDQTTNFLNDAIHREDLDSIKLILNSTTQETKLNIPELLGKLLRTPKRPYDAKTMIALASDLIAKKNPNNKPEMETQRDLIQQLGDNENGRNMLIICDLLRWSAENNCLNQIDNKNQNLLHLYCQKGHDLPIVISAYSELKKPGVNLADMADDFGNLPLHYAVKNNMTKSVFALLSTTTKINVQNKEGKTALHLAAELGNPDIINILYNRGADPHIRDHEGNTPFDIIKKNKNEMTKKNDGAKDQLTKDLNCVKDINIDSEVYKDKANGYLCALRAAYLEYHQLINDERISHEKTRIQNLDTKINDLKKEMGKILSSKLEDSEKLAYLVGVSKLHEHRMGEQFQLNRKQTDIENSAKMLERYSRQYNKKGAISSASQERRETHYTIYSGGGPKGTALVGAIIQAVEDGLIVPEKQKGAAGTSAGAIVAFLVATNNRTGQLKDKLFNLKFMSFLDDVDRAHTEKVLGREGKIRDLLRGKDWAVQKAWKVSDILAMFEELGQHRSGLFKGDAYKNWIIDQLLEKVRGTEVLDKINVELTPEQREKYEALKDEAEKNEYLLRRKAELITFQDFKDHPDLFLEFKCYGTNLATQSAEEYSAEKTPNATVLSAMRATMSLPVVFQPAYLEERRLVREENGQRFYQAVRVDDNPRIDGGLFDNFPVDAFDIDPETGEKVYNPHSTGFCLVSPAQFEEFACGGPMQHSSIDEKSFISYILKMIFGVVWGQQDYYRANGLDHERTVYVSTLGVSTLDFNLSDQGKQKLCDEGGAVGVLDYEGAHGHTLEPVYLSTRLRKRLNKNGLVKEFTHQQHVHSRIAPGRLVHPIEILKLYAKAEEKDLPTLSKLVNPNTRDEHGITALHLAKALGFKNTYERLVKYQANENARSVNGLVASEATYEGLRDYINANRQDQKAPKLPAYLFDKAGELKCTEKKFVASIEERWAQKIRKIEYILDDLEEEYDLRGIHIRALKEINKDLSKEKDDALVQLQEREKSALALREQISAVEQERDRVLAQLQERQVSELALRQQLQTERQENDNINNQLDPKKMSFNFFERYIQKEIIGKLRTVANDENVENIKNALNDLGNDLDQVLSGRSNLEGKNRITAIKKDLVKKLNKIIDGEIEQYKPLTKQNPIIALLKGFVGIILGIVCGIVPLSLKSYRNTFFNGGYARQLSQLKHDIVDCEQRVFTAVAV